MNILISIFVVAFCVFIFDKTCLWLEKKGYLYYRHKKPTKGIVGTALQELNAVLLPTHLHTIEAKKEHVICRQNKAEGTDKKEI